VNRFAVGSRIVLNGLMDIAEVCMIAECSGWLEKPAAVEAVWELIFDGRDRLDGYSGISREFVEFSLAFVEGPFNEIQTRYGHGVYCSWEVTIDSLTCSICDGDVRGCEHESGGWYDGQQCVVKPTGIKPVAIALVENPRDPRCRIWPWCVISRGSDGSVRYKSLIYCIFQPEGPEEPRSVLDPHKVLDASLDVGAAR
jgi:hypothetical protein